MRFFTHSRRYIYSVFVVVIVVLGLCESTQKMWSVQTCGVYWVNTCFWWMIRETGGLRSWCQSKSVPWVICGRWEFMVSIVLRSRSSMVHCGSFNSEKQRDQVECKKDLVVITVNGSSTEFGLKSDLWRFLICLITYKPRTDLLPGAFPGNLSTLFQTRLQSFHSRCTAASAD